MDKRSKLIKVLNYPCLLEVTYLIAITSVAFFLRFHKLGDWSLWIDEVNTIYDSVSITFSNCFHIFEKIYQQSRLFPIHYLITKIFISTLGLSEWSIRLFPCITGILTVPTSYLVFKKMFGKVEAGLCASFLALLPWHIFWSQNARYYSLLLLSGLATLYFFFSGIEYNKGKDIFIASLALIISLWIHYSIIFLIPAFVIYLIGIKIFSFKKPPGWHLKNILLFFFPLLLGLAILAPKLLFAFLHHTSPQRHYKIFPGHNPIYILMSFTYYMSIPIMVSAFFSSLWLIFHKHRAGFLVTCYAAVPLLLICLFALMAAGGSCKLFYTLPAYLILSATGSYQLFKNSKHKLVSFGFITIIFITLFSQVYLYYTHEYGYRKRWKEATFFVKKQLRSEDQIFFTEPVVNYYLDISPLNLVKSKTNKTVWLHFPIDIELLEKANRKWFLVDDDSLSIRDRDFKFRNWLAKECHLIKEFPSWTSVKNRIVKVYLYVPKQYNKDEEFNSNKG